MSLTNQQIIDQAPDKNLTHFDGNYYWQFTNENGWCRYCNPIAKLVVGEPSSGMMRLSDIEALARLERDNAELKAERDQLATLLPFIDSCIECCFEGLSYDGGDIQDHLTELGALVIEPYDSSKHTYEGWADLEDGDDFYLVAPWLKKQLDKNGGNYISFCSR